MALSGSVSVSECNAMQITLAVIVQHTVCLWTITMDTIPVVQMDRRSAGVGGPIPVETAAPVSCNPPYMYATGFSLYFY